MMVPSGRRSHSDQRATFVPPLSDGHIDSEDAADQLVGAQ
jgi:hypothetical protein